MDIAIYSRAVVVFLSCVVLCAAEADVPIPIARRMDVLDPWDGLNSFRSACGRFTVVGMDRAENVELARWSSDVAKKIETMLSVKLPLDYQHMVRIVVNAAEPGDSGRVVMRPSVRGSGFLRDLVIYDYASVDQEEAEEELCLLLMNVFLNGRDIVPRWFCRGLAQNLYQEQKSANAEYVISIWREGGLMPVVEIMKEQIGGNKRRVEKSVCGFFVGWLTTMPGWKQLLDGIFTQFAQDKNVTPEWLVAHMDGCDSVVELEEQWDSWILRQERVVHEPGRATLHTIDKIRSQLLVHSGQFGVGLWVDPNEIGSLRGLIDAKDEEWIPGLCQAKITSLRIIAMGRGDEVGAVVDAYCRFFEALRDGEKTKVHLIVLLKRADNAFERLSEMVHKEGVGS